MDMEAPMRSVRKNREDEPEKKQRRKPDKTDNKPTLAEEHKPAERKIKGVYGSKEGTGGGECRIEKKLSGGGQRCVT